MRELRVIIAGGRDFNNYQLLINKSIEIIEQGIKEDNSLEKIRIVSGTARGADRLGEQFAQDAHYDISRFPADWDFYGKSAGYRRNVEMAKFASEDDNLGVLIAFWDGKSKGTKHMIDLAKRYGLKVYIVNYQVGRKLWIHLEVMIIRRIWFKAKRVDNGEWVKGFYIYNYDMDRNYISIGNCYVDNPEQTKQYEIIPESLCQYTGIYDKNGELVWENDIVKTKYGRRCIVKYKCYPSFCGWDLEPLNGENKAPDDYDLWSKLEVLKSIFD